MNFKSVNNSSSGQSVPVSCIGCDQFNGWCGASSCGINCYTGCSRSCAKYCANGGPGTMAVDPAKKQI